MKTKNTYIYPVPKEQIVRITRDESPAHVGALKYAVDFIVPEGTPVLATADGKIVDVKNDSDTGGESQDYEQHGNYIEIEHPNREYSEYEHVQKGSVTVKVGDRVRQGQIIAKSGATGWVAHLGPHLHFMVGKYGKNVKEYETLEIRWKD